MCTKLPIQESPDTATPSQDNRIETLKWHIGPKLYEANWQDLANGGFLAKIRCVEVWTPMSATFMKVSSEVCVCVCVYVCVQAIPVPRTFTELDTGIP